MTRFGCCLPNSCCFTPKRHQKQHQKRHQKPSQKVLNFWGDMSPCATPLRVLYLISHVHTGTPLFKILDPPLASSWAGQVLAWPLFRRLKVPMCTLNMHKVEHIRTSKPSHLGKQLPFWFTLAIPYCNEAHAACGRSTQLCKFTSLVPRPRPAFHCLPHVTASDRKLGGSLGTKLLTQYWM